MGEVSPMLNGLVREWPVVPAIDYPRDITKKNASCCKVNGEITFGNPRAQKNICDMYEREMGW